MTRDPRAPRALCAPASADGKPETDAMTVGPGACPGSAGLPAAPYHRCLSSCLVLGAHPEVVPVARRHARDALREWDLDELSADACSVVTELAENAIQATRRAGLHEPVTLTLLGGLRTVLVVVRDAVADPPRPRQPASVVGPDGADPLAAWAGDPGPDDDSDPDQHGRGLLIVAALSAAWGWKPRPGGGKAVYALIRATR